MSSPVLSTPQPGSASTCSDCKPGCPHVASLAALEKEIRHVKRKLEQAHVRELEYQTQNDQFFSALLHVNRICSEHKEEATRIRESVQALLDLFQEHHEGVKEFVGKHADKKSWIAERLQTWEWKLKDWVRTDNQKEEAHKFRLENATMEYRGQFQGWDPLPPHTETDEELSGDESEMDQGS